MRPTRLLVDDHAQSEVVGTILLVAITVIVASLLTSFVFGVGSSVQNTAPSASFEFAFDTDSVTVSHEGGDSVSADATLRTTVSGGTLTGSDWESLGGAVSTGDSVTLTHVSGGSPTPWNGEEVRVVWESADGKDSATLASERAPE